MVDIESVLMSATVFAVGKGGFSAYRLEPSEPDSSAAAAKKH